MTPTATFCVTLTTKMNTLQILNVLKNDPFTKSVFPDVLPSDLLPNQIQKKPRGFILNVDTSNGPGTHWISIYITTDRKGEFFYSYGEHPKFIVETLKPFWKIKAVHLLGMKILYSLLGLACVENIAYFMLYIVVEIFPCQL